MTGASWVEDAFAGRIEPIRATALYRLGLALVAGAMVLLPVIYVALVALAAWGWWLYLSEILLAGRTGANVFTLAPLAVGGVVIFFLLKPLLARDSRRAKPLTLAREEAPGLFRLVEQLCDMLRAPRPASIDVDVQVNASAALRQGLLSLFRRDLVLTVGLPLASGLTLRQFTGVLAHELGHFSQGLGMRFSYIIRLVNNWFAAAVFGRDEWDERLEGWVRSRRRLGAIFISRAASASVRPSREILRLLMLLGHAISMFLLRLMEFDADQAVIRTVGSQSFIETCQQIHLLRLASQWAEADQNLAWSKGRLADDVPALILANLRQMKTEVAKGVLEQAMGMAGGMYDTHPSTGQRIARAQERRWEGVFRLDGDARRLFGDFAGTCRRASIHHYQHALPEALPLVKLAATETVAAEGERENGFAQARARYFGEVFDAFCCLDLPKPREQDPEELKQSYAKSRAELAEAARKRQQWEKRFQRCGEIQIALVCSAAGLRFEPQQFGVKSTGLAILEPDLEAEAAWLVLGLGVTALQDVAEAIQRACPNLLAHLQGRLAQLRGEIPQTWLTALWRLKVSQGLLNRLAWQLIAQRTVLALARNSPDNDALAHQASLGERRLQRTLRELEESHGNAPNPLGEQEGETLAGYLLGDPNSQDFLERAQHAVSRTNQLYSALLGRLAAAVEPPPDGETAPEPAIS